MSCTVSGVELLLDRLLSHKHGHVQLFHSGTLHHVLVLLALRLQCCPRCWGHEASLTLEWVSSSVDVIAAVAAAAAWAAAWQKCVGSGGSPGDGLSPSRCPGAAAAGPWASWSFLYPSSISAYFLTFMRQSIGPLFMASNMDLSCFAASPSAVSFTARPSASCLSARSYNALAAQSSSIWSSGSILSGFSKMFWSVAASVSLSGSASSLPATASSVWCFASESSPSFWGNSTSSPSFGTWAGCG